MSGESYQYSVLLVLVIFVISHCVIYIHVKLYCAKGLLVQLVKVSRRHSSGSGFDSLWKRRLELGLKIPSVSHPPTLCSFDDDVRLHG